MVTVKSFCSYIISTPEKFSKGFSMKNFHLKKIKRFINTSKLFLGKCLFDIYDFTEIKFSTYIQVKTKILLANVRLHQLYKIQWFKF